MSIKTKIIRIFKNPLLIPVVIKNKILNFYKLYFIEDEFTIGVNAWFKDNGDQNLRLNYPLTEKSIVFDLGGYMGDFAADIHNKYGCKVYLFEPIKKYYDYCLDRFRENDDVKCFNFGLSNEEGNFLININNDATSIVKKSNKNNSEMIQLKIFSDEFYKMKLEKIDLLKINVEGAEFLILQNIISQNLLCKIDNLQIQFHNFYPNATKLRNEIRETLKLTHMEIWNYPFVWESWKKI